MILVEFHEVNITHNNSLSNILQNMHSRMSNLQKRIRENISQSQNNRNLNIRLRQAQYTIISTLGLLQSKCFQSKKYTHSYRTDCNIGRYQTSCGRATLHDIKQHVEEQHCTI